MKNILIERIKQVMLEKNINSAELARLTGIRPSSLSDYFSGKYLPKQDKIALIADALSVDPGWLMGYEHGSENKHHAAEVQKYNFYASQEEQVMIQKYRLLSPEGKETVNTILDLQYKASQKNKIKSNEAI